LEDLSRPSFAQKIARVLADEIVERRLPPGRKLREQALAERFGTSRAPIREALYLLGQEGLVERTPRRGAVVKRYSPREVEEVYRIRLTLEEMALRRACDGLGMVRRAVAALEPILEDMEASRKDARRYHELNVLFHRTLVEVSGSPVLPPVYTQIEGPLRMFLRLSVMSREDVEKSIGDHRRILEAIAGGDAERAARILGAHELDGMNRALEAMREEDRRATG